MSDNGTREPSPVRWIALVSFASAVAGLAVAFTWRYCVFRLCTQLDGQLPDGVEALPEVEVVVDPDAATLTTLDLSPHGYVEQVRRGRFVLEAPVPLTIDLDAALS